MKNFSCVADAGDVGQLVQEALALKADPFKYKPGINKTLGLIFFNPSLRTRLSTQKAAFNLGMNVIVLNVGQEGWAIEFGDGTVMDGNTQEHIRDAVKVMSQYCEILGVRTFAGLVSREDDYKEKTLQAFLDHSSVPVISLESATRHPLQSLADLVTIQEQGIHQPRVTVSWAPHPKALPQAVTNSFLEWIKMTDARVTLAFPEGYELKQAFMDGVTVTHDQQEALRQADFVYAKHWSGYTAYGHKPPVKENWTIDQSKMTLTRQGKFMHCLPIRRNVIATDDVIDQSLVYQQAKNREFAAQAVLKKILEDQYG